MSKYQVKLEAFKLSCHFADTNHVGFGDASCEVKVEMSADQIKHAVRGMLGNLTAGTVVQFLNEEYGFLKESE